MRTTIICVFFLLIFYCFSADCEEYELYKEILGYPLDSSRQSLAVDKDGGLWACSGGFVFRHDGINWEDFTEISGGASFVSASPDGGLWFAAEGQIAHFDGADWIYFPNEIGLPKDISAGPNSILWLVIYDREENYYYLAKFDGQEIVAYRDGLLQHYIGRITATTEGGVWIVYNNSFDQLDCSGDDCPKGISYFNGTTFSHFTDKNGLPISELGRTDVQWIIQESESGNIYANCNRDLYIYSDDSWSQVMLGSSDGIIVNGNDSNIWLGYMGVIHNNILASLNANEWIHYNTSEISSMLFDEFKWPFSNSMAVTSDGMVWMGFNGGVLRINPKTLNSTYVESEQPTAFFKKIYCYPNPFNASTIISFDLEIPGYTEIDIYSVNGQHVRKILSESLGKGTHNILWNGTALYVVRTFWTH